MSTITNETKKEAIADLSAGVAPKEVAKKTGVNLGTVYAWKRSGVKKTTKTTKTTTGTTVPAALTALTAENARLRSLVTKLYLQTQGI